MTTIVFDIEDIVFKMDLDPSLHSDEFLLSLAKRKIVPEPETLQAMRRIVKPGNVVIDAGANVGFFTLYLARLVGPYGRVHAFEPYFVNAIRLRANIAINGFDNVIVHQEALCDRNGTSSFWPNKDNGQSALFQNGSGGKPLDVVTARLDDFDLRPTLVKMDIEGAEPLAYAAGHITLSGACVICELNNITLTGMGSSMTELRRQAMGIGQYTWVLPQDGSHPILVPITSEIRTRRDNINVLFASIGEAAKHWKEIEIA